MPEAKDDRGSAAVSQRPSVPYPAHLAKEVPPYNPRVMRVAVDRYFRRDYHDREVERIWRKTWQYACREENIPNAGDHVVYDVARLSFIIMRGTDGTIRAFWNACPHRGRRLIDFDAGGATEITCMFHGWSWDINGKMRAMPCGWDFADAAEDVAQLAEVKVGTWGGFVFINPDPDCEPLTEFLGDLPEHFEGAGHDFAQRRAQVHVVAELPVNWKVAQEAFLEAWHSAQTHPQLLRAGGGAPSVNNRWDDHGNWMRAAPALPTDVHKAKPGWMTPAETDKQVIDQHYDYHLDEINPVEMREGESANDTLNRLARDYLRQVIGDDADNEHDLHVRGGEMVAVWPNFHPWGGYSRIVYRFRPWGDDPERSLMDVLLLAPTPKGRERLPPAKPHHLKLGEPVTNAAELGHLARIFEQDVANMPKVQQGMHSLASGHVLFSQHNEAPVRRFHDHYDRAMGFENGDFMAGEGAGR